MSLIKKARESITMPDGRPMRREVLAAMTGLAFNTLSGYESASPDRRVPRLDDAARIAAAFRACGLKKCCVTDFIEPEWETSVASLP